MSNSTVQSCSRQCCSTTAYPYIYIYVCTHKHTPRPKSLVLEESYLQVVEQHSCKGSPLKPQNSHRAGLSCIHTGLLLMQPEHTGPHPCLGDLVAKLPGASIRARAGSRLCAALLRAGARPRAAALCKGAHFKELLALCFLLASHVPCSAVGAHLISQDTHLLFVVPGRGMLLLAELFQCRPL